MKTSSVSNTPGATCSLAGGTFLACVFQVIQHLHWYCCFWYFSVYKDRRHLFELRPQPFWNIQFAVYETEQHAAQDSWSYLLHFLYRIWIVFIHLLFSAWHILCHRAEVKRIGVITKYLLTGFGPCRISVWAYLANSCFVISGEYYWWPPDTAAFKCLYASALGACNFLFSVPHRRYCNATLGIVLAFYRCLPLADRRRLSFLVLCTRAI